MVTRWQSAAGFAAAIACASALSVCSQTITDPEFVTTDGLSSAGEGAIPLAENLR